MAPHQIYTCSHKGCRQTFKYRMQCWRHEQKCEHEKTEKEAVYEITEDNRFSCIKCKETFAFTPGVFKHVKEGRCENKSKKVAKEHKCTICDKIFDREFRLIRKSTQRILSSASSVYRNS